MIVNTETSLENVEDMEEEEALAILLQKKVVFLNNHWWEEKWPEQARMKTSLNVICNDLFAWGLADAETIDYTDILSVYRAWKEDEAYGVDKWCAMRRNQKPQLPMVEIMKKAGVWDEKMEALEDNYQDAEVQRLLKEGVTHD